MDDLTLLPHPALQQMTTSTAASDRAVELATAILTGVVSLQDGVDGVATHLLASPRADIVVITLTNFVPEDTTPWTRLGDRAWIREWVPSRSSLSVVPAVGSGAEAALTMPWLSPMARRDIVALIDTELLPPEATQDRNELESLGLRSIVGSTLSADGAMFGSISVTSVAPGAWPESVVADLRLLNAAITARLTLEQSRRSLAEAIEAGAEAQLAAQQFFGAVGHELRTPLSAILGHTEGLLHDAEHGTADDVAAGMKRDGPVIVRSCERLLSIVDNLLGAGRAMSANDQRQEVVVADAIADVMHWHRTPARTGGVDIQAYVDPRLAAWGHPSAIRQVLANLLSNAIAHHHPAGGTVHLSAEELVGESAKPMVRIIVRDNGPGLAPEQLAHVFEPFVRFAAPTTQGSGLGLSLSRTIAEREGGAVRGESTPGAGSSFWLELPAYRPQPGEPIPARSSG